MGSVIKRGKKFAIRYDLPGSTREDRKQKYISGFSSRPEAKRALEEIEAKISLGLIKKEFLTTVNDVVDRWYHEHVIIKLAPTSIDFYENYINNYIKEKIGQKLLHDLKTGTFTQFYNGLIKEGASNSTIDKLHRTLRAAFYYCYNQEYISTRYIDRVKVEKYHAKELIDRENYWSPEIIARAFPLLVDSPIYFHAFLALNLALRAEETAALHINDLYFEKGYITVRHAVKRIYGKEEIEGRYIRKLNHNTILKYTKGEKTRILPMTQTVKSYLKQYLADLAQQIVLKGYNHQYDGFLSVKDDGELISERQVSKRWAIDMKRLMEIDSNIPKITFHGLRHSCASYLAYKGVDMKTIQEILGHSDITITSEIYTHLDLKKKLEALEKLEE